MLAGAPEPSVRALPFADASFGAVALPYVLYHLPEPDRALAETRRVLRPGGLPRTPLTFDAGLMPSMRERFFDHVEVERWDAPALVLPSRDAVRDYLVGKGAAPAGAAVAAEASEVR